jgi:hypothetical protein
MTREEKCLLAIQLGYTYNPENGEIKNRKGKVLKAINKLGYLFIGNGKFILYQHQFAWYYMYGECVEQLDHINGVRDDNRISNLRSVTNQQNSFNKKNTKGYSWNKKNRIWISSIYLNKKSIYLGSFNTEEEAREKYFKAKEQYHII